MSELEKMLAGSWYDANNDTQLLIMRKEAESLCFEFNQTPPSDTARAERLLRKLLPQMEPGVTILSPLYADYGVYTRIGEGSWFNHGCYLMDGGTITIGAQCFIGPFCGFYTALHPLDPGQRTAGLERALPIVVKDRVWLGAGVKIMPGVTIGENSVIGAGSVVTRDVPANVVAAGNPCRILRNITEADRIDPGSPPLTRRKTGILYQTPL